MLTRRLRRTRIQRNTIIIIVRRRSAQRKHNSPTTLRCPKVRARCRAGLHGAPRGSSRRRKFARRGHQGLGRSTMVYANTQAAHGTHPKTAHDTHGLAWDQRAVCARDPTHRFGFVSCNATTPTHQRLGPKLWDDHVDLRSER